ncbi:M48 family metallopeptidase [Rhodopseudomonas julia]|uniref:M48 family metallopeptidase n=1 Tax=Rhodopseudomonas julia TaxID=200617 RepID=UPI0027D77A9C|nr:SprT family zinc-dependent metalloprotease [Rhodopseudomonas julia]
MRFSRRKTPETCRLAFQESELAVKVRRSSRARRMILRLDAATGEPLLTLPAFVPLSAGESFLAGHRDWLAERMRAHEGGAPFVPGTYFSLRGEQCLIKTDPSRGLVRILDMEEGRAVVVPGDPRHLERRLSDWLKRQARRDLSEAVGAYCDVLGVRHRRIAVRDTRSRWGSCSSTGTLSFSWRLVLAPPHVLQYVAAHEVAHLREMNHSPRFWRLVGELYPGYEEARRWLRRHGAELHRIGRAVAQTS